MKVSRIYKINVGVALLYFVNVLATTILTMIMGVANQNNMAWRIILCTCFSILMIFISFENYKDGKSIFDKTTTRPTSRFVQDENVFTCESVSLGYDIKHKGILRTLGMERLRVNAYMNDIMRLSTVRQERGINYPFANRIAFSLSATF